MSNNYFTSSDFNIPDTFGAVSDAKSNADFVIYEELNQIAEEIEAWREQNS